MNFPTLLESDDLAPGERWVTLDNGAHVKIDSDGNVVSGPGGLKGKDLDGGEEKSGQKPDKSGQSVKPVRFAAGSNLTPQQKDEVIKSMGDVYRDNNLQMDRLVSHTKNDEPIYGYPIRTDLFIRSDVTGKMIRHYVILPDGRKAHPSEVFGAGMNAKIKASISQAEIDNWNARRAKKLHVQGKLARAATDKMQANRLYAKTNRPLDNSFFAVHPDGRVARVDANDATDVEIYKELGFVRESRDRTPTLDDLRTASEAKLKRILNGLDKRHRKQLEAAIVEYGGVRNIPEIVWQQIQWEIEDETAAAIVLLMVAADEWTEDELRRQGVAGVELNTQARLGRYVPSAIQQAHTTAAVTTATTRARLERKITDALLDEEMGGTGTLTKPGIRKALDDVFTDSRRETLATDSTTGGFSTGQKGAAERLGGDGASTEAGQKVTIELRWETERDDRVCPRCSPLQDQPEEVWGRVFPNGPGPEAHPNCRCWLRSVAVVEAVTESLRESEGDEEGRWVTLDNGARVKIKDDGTVLAGPPGLEGKNVKDLGKGSEGKGEKPAEPQAKSDKPQAKPTDKPRAKVKQTETPEFKAWFGDSKVVDGEGKPLVVYHGTKFTSFNTFDTKHAGTNTGAKSAKAGIWLSASPQHASNFAKGDAGNVLPTFVSLKNPLIVDHADTGERFLHQGGIEQLRLKAISTAKKQNRDGVIFKNTWDTGARNSDDTGAGRVDLYLAFHPSQIKSATGNRGTFDPNSDDIRESLET